VELTEDILRLDTVIYVFDETLTIVEVNEAFVRFAEENQGGADFRAKYGEGCNLLDMIPPRLRPFYSSLYLRAFNGEVVVHDYECHTPSSYRLFRLRLIPLADGRVAAENSLRVETALADPLGLDEAAIVQGYVAPSGLIIQCMHCRRIKTTTPPERWDLIPSLIKKPDERISHGLCPVCLPLYYPD
jgi:hypothetical protein